MICCMPRWAGGIVLSLLQCPYCMADWKQITARIRRARTGKDPAGQLSNLYQKTRDAMVAFELAKFFETAGQSGEAAKWYSTAAERFRRADWRTKAQEAAAPRFSRVTESVSPPRLPTEPVPDTATSVRGRYGDPGLSSRLSLLEMQFRRLLTCPPLKLSEADHAPVGPGVLLLSDSDLSTYYYVEPRQTLRIAIGSFLRGAASRRGAESIKPRLADHLGIAETRVTKYLADHCVVRYLQLDEGASHFAHFVTAVLRPTLNE